MVSMAISKSAILKKVYQRLFDCYGPQHWWPGETPFEVIVGAILTQSAAWTNVEKAILKLKTAYVLNPQSMQKISHSELAALVHSCGYYNMKAKKLQAFLEWLDIRFGGSLERMFDEETFSLRRELLEVHGIGEETADSILLYAGNKPVFVIDAYTRRIVDRIGLTAGGPRYADYQKLFMSNLSHDIELFNEYHALLVALGKNCCLKTSPRCGLCCLKEICEYAVK
jgi:endonuclease-3 related protein